MNKETYWKNRKEGKRGQGEQHTYAVGLTTPEDHSQDGARQPFVTIKGKDGESERVYLNRAKRRQRSGSATKHQPSLTAAWAATKEEIRERVARQEARAKAASAKRREEREAAR